MSERLIDAVEVAAICGRKSRAFVWERLKTDPTFPRPVATRKHPKGGNPMRFWRAVDIATWAAAEAAKKRLGRPTEGDKLATEQVVQFICGLFDPPDAQRERQRRIEKARKNGIKNQPRIRIEGVWL